ASLTGGLLALRSLNVYGDPGPWSAQRDGLYTALSFLNCQKYPPSLLFLLMTLGSSLLLLGALERGVASLRRPLAGVWLVRRGQGEEQGRVVELSVAWRRATRRHDPDERAAPFSSGRAP